MSFVIRTMAAEDLDRLLALAADSEAPRWTRSDYERILEAEPSDPLHRCALVALAGGNLAGFAVATWLQQEPSAELEGVFVNRACRRQGIGGA